MRLWSIHPRYLDAKGLVALWREGLLAQKVLQGLTRGYRHHPQLVRFKKSSNPQGAIGSYLEVVYSESIDRGYRFDAKKIHSHCKVERMLVTSGQVGYEWQHLLSKLAIRDQPLFKKIKDLGLPDVNPVFSVIQGEIEDWEVRNIPDNKKGGVHDV